MKCTERRFFFFLIPCEKSTTMTGSIIQLDRTGPEDHFLLSPNRASLFTTAYVHVTPFAKENVPLSATGPTAFDQEIEFKLNKGDLMGTIYAAYSIPAIRHRDNPKRPDRYGAHNSFNFSDKQSFSSCSMSSRSAKHMPRKWAYWNNWFAHLATEWAAFKCGDSEVDRHYGEWMELWDDYTCPAGKETDSMIGRFFDERELWKSSQKDQTRYCQMQFSFCKYIGMALPIVSIYNTPLTLVIKTRSLKDCWLSSDGSRPYLMDRDREVSDQDLDVKLYANLIFLSEAERLNIHVSKHEYLIHQLQFNGGMAVRKPATHNNSTTKCELPFKKHVIELFITLQDEEHVRQKDWFNYSGLNGEDPIKDMGIFIDGKVKCSLRDAKWFRIIEPHEHHSKLPRRHSYSFSFAVKPENTCQPTGVCNCNQMTISIEFRPQPGLNDSVMNVWATNFNKFHVNGGLAGTLY